MKFAEQKNILNLYAPSEVQLILQGTSWFSGLAVRKTCLVSLRLAL